MGGAGEGKVRVDGRWYIGTWDFNDINICLKWCRFSK